jgi:hypothetical protein
LHVADEFISGDGLASLGVVLRNKVVSVSTRPRRVRRFLEFIMADTTKFAAFILAKKLDPRRIAIASTHLESLLPEDRALRLAKRIQRKAEGGEKKVIAKPRSGRPVTARAMQAALSGAEAVSGPTKTRILRAVNHLLEQKKSDKVELKTLF